MKKIILVIILLLTNITTINASTKNFTIPKEQKILENTKQDKVKELFPKNYNLNYLIKSSKQKIQDEIIKTSKKATYLLLGKMNNENESAKEYYNRKKEYEKFIYDVEVPKDKNSSSGYDENSEEYKDMIITSNNVIYMFNLLNNIDIIYNSFGQIAISKSNNMIFSTVILPNVRIKKESEEDPMKFVECETNFILYYTFKKDKIKDEYKLFYVEAERRKNINELENKELIEKNDNNIFYSKFNKILDFSNIENVTEKEYSDIYSKNKQNIIKLNSYNNNKLISSANGVLICDGLVVTTWDFIKESLIKGQYVIAKNIDEKNFEIDGIVTISLETNLTIIKLRSPEKSTINISKKNIDVKDEVIYLKQTDKNIQDMYKGIVFSNDGYIETTVPIENEEQGTSLFNKQGDLIGISIIKSVNKNSSYAISNEALVEIQDKFKKLKFDEIKIKTFNELKTSFYLKSKKEENNYNHIPEKIWKNYKQIGNVEKTITLDLIKASYKNNIISLRYKNNISKFIPSFQLLNGYIIELEKEKYINILNTDVKKVYKNKEYKITIIKEYDYIIISMVRI